MNKKEEKYVEELKIRLALRWTDEVKPDIPKPTSLKIVNGYQFNSYSKRVEKSCSDCICHSNGNWDRTKSQNPIEQYSTKLIALKAMRNELEYRYATELRTVDKMIENEIQLATDGEPVNK